MSLQSDFELCLEYAEAVEAKRDQCIQAQNNIIVVQNEGERLGKRLKLCTVLAVLSAIGLLFIAAIMVTFGLENTAELFSGVIALAAVFITSAVIGKKANKEFREYKIKKPVLIKQYTEDAENYQRELSLLVEEIYQKDLTNIVPPDYFSVAAIEFCLTQVRKKIATTATEAFRLLEAEIKRLEQLELLEQMNDARAEQLEEIKRAIHINTAVTLMEQNRNK